ncbi:unnamed protein product [Leptidea sinapis]|uniref:U2A'/phosphoprotein 32 family A C-terminal domain-containing protein n=1 Tax=Leptidea sinapis TaxID=189913 RepID=A0A5E4QGR6_9NEOP|nr:unnamed protein product [Leptidea sinapis]
MYGAKVNYLDLSFNSIETLKGLERFTRLEELVLDNNKLGDTIVNLEALINKLCDSYPSLSYLSLLSNKACPNQLSDRDKDESDYQRYRYYVLYKLSNLHFLDSRRVSPPERLEASSRGEFTRVRRPSSNQDVTDTISPPPAFTARPLPNVRKVSIQVHRQTLGRKPFYFKQ